MLLRSACRLRHACWQISTPALQPKLLRCHRSPLGASRPALPLQGYFVEPTVFADVTDEMTIAREGELSGGPSLSGSPSQGTGCQHAPPWLVQPLTRWPSV